MEVICSFCRKSMGAKSPLEDTRVTHSICSDCEAYFTRQWSGMNLGDYLEEFDFPILLVDQNARVLALNRPMTQLLGKPATQAVGLLGGEVMECAYARLPEGCGNTKECVACGIRNAVTETFRTGNPLAHRKASLNRDDGVVEILFSTSRLGPGVRIDLEEIGSPLPPGETANQPSEGP